MSLVDRAALSRCAVVLAGGAWGLLILVIGGLLFLLTHLGDPPTISAGTIEAGSSPANGLAIGSTLAGHAATVIGVGIGLFVVIAIGSSLSGAALAGGASSEATRRPKHHGHCGHVERDDLSCCGRRCVDSGHRLIAPTGELRTRCSFASHR